MGLTLEQARAWRKAFGLPDADDEDVVRDTEADQAYLALPATFRVRQQAPWESTLTNRRARESLRHMKACGATEARMVRDRPLTRISIEDT